MHLYFQNVHEEHKMGLGQTLIQFVKSATLITCPHCEVVQPSQTRSICPLPPQSGSIENLLGARVFPLIGNNYEGHNKSSQF